MISSRIEKLGERLSDAFTERARHYFTQAASSEGTTKSNQNIIGVILGEVANVIRSVTKGEKE